MTHITQGPTSFMYATLMSFYVAFSCKTLRAEVAGPVFILIHFAEPIEIIDTHTRVSQRGVDRRLKWKDVSSLAASGRNTPAVFTRTRPPFS